MAAVIFDLDDTLYPHAQFVHSGFAAVAAHVDRRFGVPACDAYATLRFSRDLGHRGAELQRLCEVHDLDRAILPDLLQVYRTHIPQLWLTHDAVAALDGVRALGWQTAVLTNGRPAVQAAKVKALGLERLVDHVVYAEQYAPGGKPAIEAFREVLRRLQVGAEDAVMVGNDPATDILGGRAAGVRTVLLARDGVLRPAGADAVLRLLTDVPRVASELVGQRVANAA